MKPGGGPVIFLDGHRPVLLNTIKFISTSSSLNELFFFDPLDSFLKGVIMKFSPIFQKGGCDGEENHFVGSVKYNHVF
jgi:hypothetical protein